MARAVVGASRLGPRVGWLVGVTLCLCFGAVSVASAAPTIEVLSNRADLVSGGDALVAVSGVDPSAVRMAVDGRDVTQSFAMRTDGRFDGLLTDLKVGPNVVTAELPDGSGARLTITNHPIGGPVFSGPQTQPWVCETQTSGLPPAVDAQCNAPAKYEFFFKNAQTGQFEPYSPAAPPPSALVAQTTTDQGVAVPYIVRQETGTLNRAVYQIAVLFDPAKPWQPWAPQPAWNHKLYYLFQGGAMPQHRQGPVQSTTPETVQNDMALSRGFAVAQASLNIFGQNTNTVTSAETVMMVKEHIVETLGEIRYTMSEGSSGGSIQQQLFAESYPGLTNGIQPSLSFQDIWTTNREAQDCSLLLRYFKQSLQLWTDSAQQDAVLGNSPTDPVGPCRGWSDAFVLDKNWGDPASTSCFRPSGSVIGPGVPMPWMYGPAANPGGARCTLQDYQEAMFGLRPASVWGPIEQQLGRGFANRPYDNVGVQYGLRALSAGTITAEQFVDMNEKVGGRDIDWNWQPERSVADPFALAVAYRSGQVNSGRWAATVPIFDLRSCNSTEIHSCYHTWVMRARIAKANGTVANQVIFYGGGAAQSFTLLDRWLAAVEADTSSDPLSVKVIRDKPAGAVDSCWSGSAQNTNPSCFDAFPYYGEPSIAAGGPFTIDILKCQLRPLNRSDYNVTFTDAQWARLQAAFPTGVCDWTKPSVGYGPTVPWLTYANGPGGQPLGNPPRSQRGARARPDRGAIRARAACHVGRTARNCS